MQSHKLISSSSGSSKRSTPAAIPSLTGRAQDSPKASSSCSCGISPAKRCKTGCITYSRRQPKTCPNSLASVVFSVDRRASVKRYHSALTRKSGRVAEYLLVSTQFCWCLLRTRLGWPCVSIHPLRPLMVSLPPIQSCRTVIAGNCRLKMLLRRLLCSSRTSLRRRSSRLMRYTNSTSSDFIVDFKKNFRPKDRSVGFARPFTYATLMSIVSDKHLFQALCTRMPSVRAIDMLADRIELCGTNQL